MVWMGSQAFAGEAEIEGKGALWARGVGIAHLKGVGHVKFELHGAGVLRIRNVSTVRVEARGEGKKYKIGDTLYLAGWKGVVKIRSKVTSAGTRTRINARFAGGRVKLWAVGKGRVYLKGHGKYKTKGGPIKKWRKSGSNVEFG